MGFFRKLFGGDEEEKKEPTADTAPVSAAPARVDVPLTALDDPFRGSVLVADSPEEHVEITKNAKPMWHWRSRVLCIEPGVQFPLRSMIYTGKPTRTSDAVRRITFGDGGYRVDWEHPSFHDAVEGWIVRVDDRILFPGESGVGAVHIVTGEPCWELPHPARLAKKPVLHRAGGIFLLFSDQRWMRVDPRDGSTLAEGIVKNDRESSELLDVCSELGPSENRRVDYGGRRVGSNRVGIYVEDEGRATEGEPRGPTPGAYPLDDGWEACGWMALAGGKLAVRLQRAFGGNSAAAVGLFDPTSLEPMQLLELGEADGDGDAWVVDDLLIVDLDLRVGSERDVLFVIDPHAERVIAMFDEDGRESFLFDRNGARIWQRPL